MFGESPRSIDVERKFLEFVEAFHREHGFHPEYVYLARQLGVTVQASTINAAFSLGSGQDFVSVDIDQPGTRLRFSGFHEVSHHLFKKAYGGELVAALYVIADGDDEKFIKLEEDMCNLAASYLLMPTSLLKQTADDLGFSPLAVFELAQQTGASHQAATRRFIQAHSYDVIAVLVDNYRVGTSWGVSSTFSHGPKWYKYSLNIDRIEDTHPLVAGAYTVGQESRFEARVPQKNSNRNWKAQVIAAQEPTRNRILGFFMEKGSSVVSGKGVQSLFDF